MHKTLTRIEKDRTGVDCLYVEVNYTPDGSFTKNTSTIKTNLGPIVKDAWQQVVLRVRREPNDNGVIELYINGQANYIRLGIISYKDPSGKNNRTYPRIGLYAPNDRKIVSDYTPISVIYFDDFRIGLTRASVEFNSSSPPPDARSIRVEAEQMFLSTYLIESGHSTAAVTR